MRENRPGTGGKGETAVLPEVQGVDVGEKQKRVYELGDSDRCKCNNIVHPTDRVCSSCGVLLSRGGEILPLSKNKPPAKGKPTESFVSTGAVEMRGENGEARGSKTLADLKPGDKK